MKSSPLQSETSDTVLPKRYILAAYAFDDEFAVRPTLTLGIDCGFGLCSTRHRTLSERYNHIFQYLAPCV